MRPYLLLALTCLVMHFSSNAGTGPRPVSPGDSSSVSIHSMQDMLEMIESVLHTKYHYTLKAADVNNMEARKIGKRREIRYNPSFVQYVLHSTHDKWGLIFLLAHEIGHHELGHTAKKLGSHPSVELEADEFAGALLRRLGASLSESQEVMLFISSSIATKTHPGRLDRMVAIGQGWRSYME